MPGPLKNHRHELFALALAEGKSACDAYVAAGFVWNDSNCIRLKQNPKIQARLQELQQDLAKATEITIASIVAELDEANTIARANGQATAMVSAATLKAKLAGLLETRIKTEVDINVTHFDSRGSIDDIATKLAAGMVDNYDALTPADLVELGKILQEATAKATEFIRGCRARTVNASFGQRQIEARASKANGHKQPFSET
jgi:hypothetical protein